MEAKAKLGPMQLNKTGGQSLNSELYPPMLGALFPVD